MATLFSRLADWLIARSMRTPYSHLKGYMERYWLIPYHTSSNSVQLSGSASTDPTKWPGQFPILAHILALFGIGIRVHHILRSDDDRAFHDHPWGFISVVLKGGYWEHTPMYDESGIFMGNFIRWRGVGSIAKRKATDWHRIEMPRGETAWTLFITFKWRQRWGFLKHPGSKVHFAEYLDNKDEMKPVVITELGGAANAAAQAVKKFGEAASRKLSELPEIEDQDEPAPEILLVPETSHDGVKMHWEYDRNNWTLVYDLASRTVVFKPKMFVLHGSGYMEIPVEDAYIQVTSCHAKISPEDRILLEHWLQYERSKPNR